MHLETLQSLALSLAAARSADAVLRQAVQGLGMTPGVALARVWLISDAMDEAPYLELKASIGSSIAQPDVRWNRTDGSHSKIALSFGKVGKVARENVPLLLHRGISDWLVHPDWADAEKIQSFAAQPLTFKGEVLGVLALFSRLELDQTDLAWLRVYADHAALAVANARMYEELERLKNLAEQERDYLRAEVREALQHGAIVAESPAMRHVLEQAAAVAQSDSPVLVLGESGVGKELVATAVHDFSQRRTQPLVKVNCASIPHELFESEFFGHVRGAFSGAVRDREGRFALADGGTLFLDEVGELPLSLQGKLLRVLQERSYETVGDDRTKQVDVRLIAATNRSLEEEVQRGTFRRDLYYRLSVLPISVPPLRERPEDVLPMARRLVDSASRRLNFRKIELSAADEEALLRYSFPGNVRELQNIIERAVVLGAGRQQHGLMLNKYLSTSPSTPPAAREPSTPSTHGEVLSAAQLRQFEADNLRRALQLTDGQIAGEHGAAQLLGLSPSTLSYRLKQFGIERDK